MKSFFTYQSPLGPLGITEEDGAIVGLFFGAEGPKADETQQQTPVLQQAQTELDEYFAGARDSFTLPLAPKGTEFQKKVWAALCEIPCGETRSYKQVAQAVGSPKGYRAVGLANNKNPIALLVPCHRVVGSGGQLTGYAYGLDTKQKLLNHEKKG